MPEASKLATPKRLTGQKVGKYVLGDLLGQGAYGDVYVGAAKNSQNVAVKLLDASAARDAEVVARFKREAETAQRLDHPNIIRVLDIGSSRGRHYLVMELIHGGSLRKMLDRKAPADQVLAVLAEVASALAYAHEQGVVHRDVKPENVLLTKSRRARVADFGLARSIDQTSMTTEGRLLGTAHYMSTEQARGGRATPASDVYAMGVMIYEAICGKRPFASEQPIGLLYQHAEVEPERPVVRRPYPGSLAVLALACLAKDPAARPSMAEVAERLAATRLVAPRRWLRVLAIAAAVLAACAILAIAAPSVLDPLCGKWFGGRVFRTLRSGASGAHHAISGHH